MGDSDDISCLLTAHDQDNLPLIYAGLKNGDIKVYSYSPSWSREVDIDLRRTLYSHADRVTFLKAMSNNRIMSASYGGHKGQEIQIWSTVDYNSFTLDTGSNGSFCSPGVQDMTELGDGLVAICGDVSESWGAFHVIDTVRNCLVDYDLGRCHRPHGMSVVTARYGYLAVIAHCAYKLVTWKVTNEERVEVDSHECQRAYCVTSLTTGKILVGGYQIQMFDVDVNGILHLVCEFKNRNVIYRMFPFGGYGLVTVDAGSFHSGIIRKWDLLEEPSPDDSTYLGSFSSICGSDCDGFERVVPRDGVVIYVKDSVIIGKRTLKNSLKYVDVTYETRKNARVISCAKRGPTTHGFALLPPEVLLNIIALSGQNDKVGWNKAYAFANKMYGRRV